MSKWYIMGDNQQMRRVLTMNEKKQSGYPQEDPREALERLMQFPTGIRLIGNYKHS